MRNPLVKIQNILGNDGRFREKKVFFDCENKGGKDGKRGEKERICGNFIEISSNNSVDSEEDGESVEYISISDECEFEGSRETGNRSYDSLINPPSPSLDACHIPKLTHLQTESNTQKASFRREIFFENYPNFPKESENFPAFLQRVSKRGRVLSVKRKNNPLDEYLTDIIRDLKENEGKNKAKFWVCEGGNDRSDSNNRNDKYSNNFSINSNNCSKCINCSYSKNYNKHNINNKNNCNSIPVFNISAIFSKGNYGYDYETRKKYMLKLNRFFGSFVYPLTEQTVYLVYNLLDLMGEYYSILHKHFDLISLGCLFIAGKYEEIYPPEI